MTKRENDIHESLDKISAMLFTLSELIKHQNREPHVSEEWFNIGLAEIIAVITEDIPKREE